MMWFILCMLLLLPLSNVLASTAPNGSLINNKSVSTLGSIQNIIENSQNSGVLGRMAKCGATMQNMTEEQHQCVDNMAMGLEGLK